MREARALADHNEVPIHIHIAETQYEWNNIRNLFGLLLPDISTTSACLALTFSAPTVSGYPITILPCFRKHVRRWRIVLNAT